MTINQMIKTAQCVLKQSALIVAALMLAQPVAQAASGTWGGATDATWAGNNWGGVSPVPGTGDTATFSAAAGTGGAVIDLGGGVTIKNIIFDTSSVAAYTIGRGTVGSQTLIVNNSGAITMNAPVANDQLFNAAITLGTDKTTQTYTLTQNSTSKTLTLAGNITGNNSSGTAGNKTLAITGAGNTTISGIIANGGALTVPLTKSGAGTLTLSGANTFSGAITVSAGTLVLNGSGVVGGNMSVNAASTLTLDNTTTSVNNRLGNGKTFTPGGATLNLNGAATEAVGALTPSSGLNTINTSGSSTLTFASQGTRAAGGVVVVSSSGESAVKFTTAPTLTPASTGILPGYFVGNDFVTHGGNGTALSAFSSYTTGDLNAAGATATVNPSGAQTAVNTKTINALKLTGGGVNINGGQTLTLTAGSLINNGGGNISGGTLASPVEFIVNNASDMTINSRITCTSGLTKLGTGKLTLTGTNVYAGSITLLDGSLTLGAGNYTMGGNVALPLNKSTSTLDLGASSQYIGNLSSGSATSGGTITGTGGRLTISQSTDLTFAGAIAGSLNVVKANAKTLTLTSANSTTGSLTVMGGGVTVKDSGTMQGVSRISLNQGLLTVDNTGTGDMTDRVKNDAPISSFGGSLTYLGRASTASTETLGAINLNRGSSTITVTAGTSGSADLTIASLGRTAGSGATVNFGTLGASGNKPRININGASVTSRISDGVIINGIIPWAVVNNELASYRDYVTSPAQYGIGSLGQSGYSAYDATQTSGDYSTKNFSLSGPLTLTGDLKVNALRAGGQNVAFTTGTETLNLTAGALIVQGTVNNTIGATPDSGRITAGGTASSGTSDLYVHVYNNAFKCNSRIIDNPNGARVRLVMAGYGNGGFSIYAPGNNYTGGTVVNGNNGLLTLAAASGVVIPNSNDPAAGLIINDFCTVTESGVAGQIGSGNIVTLNGYAKLTLVGGDTLAGLVFNNNSGSSAPTVTPTGILTLNGDISCTPSNVAATAIISGGTLNLNSRTCAVEVKPLPEGNYYLNGANWTALKGLTISSVVTSGGLTVKGGGVLELSGANTFSGQLTVESGVLNMGSINNVSANGALGNSASAVILGKNDGSTGTLEYTGSTATSSKPFTMATGGVGAFQVDTAANTLTLSGLIDGSGGLTKTGPGTLKLTYADTYSGNTTISAGTLKLDTAGSIASTPVINIAGGATFDVTTLTTALTLGSGQTLQSCASNTPAILLTAASKTVTLGASSPLAFTAFKPAELGGAVPLTISGAGDLILQSGTPVTVTVANDGIPLPIGTYKLIATNGAGGVVSMLPGGTLTVDGDGAGKASLVLTSGELYLNVTTNKSKIGTIVSFF